MPLLVLLMTISTATVAVAGAATPKYRLGATKYSLTMSSSLEMKMDNCRSNFGQGSTLLDMKRAREDFGHDEAAFNEALASVFFKQPTSAFMVLYDGKEGPYANDPNTKYAVKTDAPSTTFPTIDSFGHARVIAYHHEAPILCTVVGTDNNNGGENLDNVDRDSTATRKVYVPKDQSDSNGEATTSGMLTTSNMVLAMLVLGVVGVVVNRRSNQDADFTYTNNNANNNDNNANGLSSIFQRTFRNVLGTEAPNRRARYQRHYDHHDDLGVNLTDGCELSYNPSAVAEALVHPPTHADADASAHADVNGVPGGF